MNYWLVKSEPNVYSFDQLVLEGIGIWDGVRNYQARNNLKNMQVDDKVLFYHSNIGKEIVGLARVHESYFQDPTTTDTRWVSVALCPLEKFLKPVTLEEIKKTKGLEQLPLIRHTRLSVMPITKAAFDIIYAMGMSVTN